MATNALARRWEFDVPNVNNLLQPIQQGIARADRLRQQDVENRRADEQMGMQRERFGMERERFNLDKERRAKEAAGNLALLTLQESDPTRRAEKWKSFLATHPNAAGLDPKYHDPGIGPMAVLADAGMAQSYLDHQMKRAAEARAAESLNLQRNADSRAAAAHAATMSQYQSMSPAQRAQAAPTLGLRPGTPEHNVFISTGQYTPPGDPLRSVKDGETLLRVPKAPGAPPEVVWQGQGNKADIKFGEAAATSQVSRYDETLKQGTNQQAAVGTISTLRGLSDKIGAPGVGNTIARTLGPSLRNVGIEVGNLSDMEAFSAIVARLVPTQRPPGSGTMSDKDVELFKQALPQLAATAQGRKLILDQMEAIARYDIQRAQIASKALNNEIPRQQAEKMLREMPDPMELFRRSTGSGGAGPGASAGGGAIPAGNYVYDPATGQLRPK